MLILPHRVQQNYQFMILRQNPTVWVSKRKAAGGPNTGQSYRTGWQVAEPSPNAGALVKNSYTNRALVKAAYCCQLSFLSLLVKSDTDFAASTRERGNWAKRAARKIAYASISRPTTFPKALSISSTKSRFCTTAAPVARIPKIKRGTRSCWAYQKRRTSSMHNCSRSQSCKTTAAPAQSIAQSHMLTALRQRQPRSSLHRFLTMTDPSRSPSTRRRQNAPRC